MSFKEITMFTVICERCGKDVYSDCDTFSCAGSKQDALDIALDEFNWHEIAGRHYCPDCVEWNEDESELIPKQP